MGPGSFDDSLKTHGLFPLTASGIRVLQINLGRLCNQACRHCHADSGPDGAAMMTEGVMEACLCVIRKERFDEVDITGGAPELHQGYRKFVSECASTGIRVKTRTNLTVLLDGAFGDLPGFWAERRVEVVASLPYYSGETVDRQRGKGVFAASIEAIKKLNSAGFGAPGSGLSLNLVYNPCGAYLPPPQRAIEADFRRELLNRYGVSFTGLYTITNMPIGRFHKFLTDSGNMTRYMDKLKSSFNPEAACNVMCKITLSVGPDGTLHDCDFNQMLGLKCGYGAPCNITDFNMEKLEGRRIVTGPHCYGCTAGAGSSCTGAVA